MKPVPKPSYLDDFQVWRVSGGRKVWRNRAGDRYYTWDSQHGEIEVFNTRGAHLGVLHAITGQVIKPPVKGRRLNVD